MLGNNDVRIGYVVTGTEPSAYYRNAIGDECVYVEPGTRHRRDGLRRGDLPGRRLRPDPARDHAPLGRPPSRAGSIPIEANSHIAPPKRYLSRYGQLLEHAPYCERDLHGPTEPLLAEGVDVEVLVKHRTSAGVVGTRMTYATHPFDVVGWDGCLYPYTFNIDDYMPITGKIHQPPPVHQVFEGHNFVVCNFLPRKVDYHQLAIPVPYYHSNVDSDEVMFYVGGDYEARKGSGIGLGSISLHPGGHAHGPQPSAIEASLGVEYFEESAVMVDTFAPARPRRGRAGRRGPGVRMELEPRLLLAGSRTETCESSGTVPRQRCVPLWPCKPGPRPLLPPPLRSRCRLAARKTTRASPTTRPPRRRRARPHCRPRRPPSPPSRPARSP